MLRNVHPDFPPMRESGTVALNADIYEAWTNSHGAVCAICANGELLGLKPHEFEVVEWHEEPKAPGENGEAFATMPGGARSNRLPEITAGAMRAARRICIEQGREDAPDFIIEAIASTIDHVTGLPQLIAAIDPTGLDDAAAAIRKYYGADAIAAGLEILAVRQRAVLAP